MSEFFCSLWMMRSTQGWSGGAQSWRPLAVVNLESEVREKEVLEPNFLAGPCMMGKGWGPHLRTLFRDFLERAEIGKERGDKKVRADREDEARCTPFHNSHNGRHSAAISHEKVAKGSHDVPRDWA